MHNFVRKYTKIMEKISRFSIIWKEKVGSTNEEMHSLLPDLESFSVLAAFSQDKGRGQGDHKWHSEEGRNLTFSILVKYDAAHLLKARDQQLLTMAASLAAVDFLSENNIEVSIKMPNDIYLKDKKICGMLIENGLNGGNMQWSIVGIGLNVNEKDFPEDLPNPVSMSLATGSDYDIKKCLRGYLRHFSTRFDAIWSEPDVLKRDYNSKLISLMQ